jgi:hypothetical protein
MVMADAGPRFRLLKSADLIFMGLLPKNGIAGNWYFSIVLEP